MDFVRTGIILCTEKYVECVTFYESVFKLKKLFEKDEQGFRLTCFDFFGSYFLVEMGGVAKSTPKSIRENPTKLRFNVENLENAQQSLLQRNIDCKIEHYEWGDVINIVDPDGNRIGIRQENSFLSQMDRV